MPSSSGVPGPAIKSFLAGAGTLDRLEIKNIGLDKQFLAAEKFWNPYRKLRKLYEASKAKARTLIGG